LRPDGSLSAHLGKFKATVLGSPNWYSADGISCERRHAARRQQAASPFTLMFVPAAFVNAFLTANFSGA